MQYVKVRLYEPLESGGRPLADMDLNPDITAISWTSQLPGGPNTLSVGIEEPDLRAGWGASYAFIPDAIRIKPLAHVVVSVAGMDVWEGRVMEVEDGPLGEQAFIADGYALCGTNTDFYESTSVVETTTSDIISDIITAAASLINQGSVYQFEDPMVTHTRSEFDQFTLAEALDLVLREGGNGYVTWDWWLEAGRRLALHPRTAPAVPDYVIPYQSGRVTVRRNYREIITAAKVAYQFSGVEFETDVDVRENTVTEFGFSRRIRIQADELSSTAAEQLRTTELARNSSPIIAITVSRGPSDDDWLTTASGVQIPHWAVMAGQWVKVANYDPQIIVSAQFDPTNGLSLELGAMSRQSFTAYLAATCTEVNKLVKGVNPRTGGRRRGIRQGAAVAEITNAFGTFDGTIADVTASHNQTVLNANFRDLSDTQNLIITALRNAKLLP